MVARASAAWFTFRNGYSLNINKTQVLNVHWGSSVANEWLITLRFDPFTNLDDLMVDFKLVYHKCA